MSFVSQIQQFEFSTLRGTMLQTYLVEKKVYPYESQQFVPFIYFGRCVHTHVLYLMSEE